MVIFDKSTIENFAKKIDDEVIENSLSILSNIISKAMLDIKKHSPYISDDYEILKINEFYSGAVLPTSNLEIMLILNSPQLEFNTVKLVKKKFTAFLNRVKSAWKKSKKKSKKNKYIDNEQLFEKYEKGSYSLPVFEIDLVNAISNYITPLTIVSKNNDIIQISGEDIPFKVTILPVINKFGSYNFYSHAKNKFENIDFKNRFKILEEMYQNYEEKVINLLRIFNALYFNLYDNNANSILIESLVYNLPKETYEKKSNYEMFVFATNYLANTKISSLVSIVDQSKKIFQDKLCSASVIDVVNFIKDIKKYSM